MKGAFRWCAGGVGFLIALALSSATAEAAKPKLSLGDVTVGESRPAAKFKVTLSRKASRTVRAKYETIDGTALAGEDYQPASGRVRLAAGKKRVTISVSLTDDHATEPDEEFSVRISKPRGARLADPVGRGTLRDDDPHVVVVNEIMANPSQVDDTAGEWVELRNPGDDAIDLSQWTLTDSGNTVCTLAGQLAASDVFLIAQSSSAAANGGLPTPDDECGLSLTNTDVLTLREPPSLGGDVVDVLDFSSGSGFAVPNGASLQLDPASADPVGNDEAGNWCTATVPYGEGDFGSPGSANASCP